MPNRIRQAKRAALKQLTTVVFSKLDTMSYIEAGALLRSHLDDFVSGVYFLTDLLESLTPTQLESLPSAKDVNAVHEDLKPTLRRLCQLSREVTFAADPTRLPVDLRSAIEALFQFVVEQVPVLSDQDVRDYLENIRERTMQPIAIV